MSRTRSRVVETEMVNPRILGKRAIKRQHIDRWAVGNDEIAPGVIHAPHLGAGIINESHIHPSMLAVAAQGELIRLTGTAVDLASGGSYLVHDTIERQLHFATVTAAGEVVTLPRASIYAVELHFAWDAFDGGGLMEIEINGDVRRTDPDDGDGSGSRFVWPAIIDALAGDVLKIKVTHDSATAEAATWDLTVAAIEPLIAETPLDDPATPDLFWMDASQIEGLADGDPFDNAPNLTTSALTFYGFDGTTGGTQRPLFKTNVTNGLPALRYDGVNDISYLYATSTTEANFFDGAADYPSTVFAVVIANTLSDACIIGQGSASAGFFNTFHSGLGIRANGNVRGAITNNGGAIAEGGTILAGTPVVLAAVLESGDVDARLNGVEVATSAVTKVPWDYKWSTLGGTNATGTSPSGNQSLFDGWICEIRHYAGRLDATTIAEIEAYLTDKWVP